MDDVAHILHTIYRAEMTFDDGDFDAHMALWGPEVAFDSPFGGADSAEAYRGFLQGFFGQVSGLGGTRHFVHNPVVSIDGDRATVHAYLHVVNKKTGGFMGTSVITDHLARFAGGWRFTRRAVAPDQELGDLLGGGGDA